MGKKAKKKGSGKKKKGGKKKKSGEPQMTWKEALLAYQINIKEKTMEDIRYELKALEEKNQRHKERNERLAQEQLLHIKNMLKQAEEYEKKLAGEDVMEKEHVIAVMMENWEAARQEEKNIADLKERIARKEAVIVTEQKRVQYWVDYQVKGQHEHGKQIRLLEQELVDMQHSFEEMSGHLTRTLDQAKDEIQNTTEETLGKQKYLAAEKAMAKMDKYSRQEVLDNDWLVREVKIHQEEMTELLKEVEGLEKDNLLIMSELFECHVDDLKISRNFYLTQFGDEENLDETGILEMDLSKLALDRTPRGDKPARPKSAMQKAIEHKVFSVQPPEDSEAGDRDEDVAEAGGDGDDDDDDDDAAHDDDDEEEEEEEEEGINYSHQEGAAFDGVNGPEGSEDGDPFSNYFQFDDEDFDDYLKLGPLELKLLSINGQSKPIYRPDTPPLDEIDAQKFKPDLWPVTSKMLAQSLPQTTPRSRKK